MISFHSPETLCCSSNDFWHLPISKTEFDRQPEYHLGQTVFHKIQRTGGEILHPAKIVGLYWDGIDWVYSIDLPPEHPQFQVEDCEWLSEVSHWQLEAM